MSGTFLSHRDGEDGLNGPCGGGDELDADGLVGKVRGDQQPVCRDLGHMTEAGHMLDLQITSCTKTT